MVLVFLVVCAAVVALGLTVRIVRGAGRRMYRAASTYQPARWEQQRSAASGGAVPGRVWWAVAGALAVFAVGLGALAAGCGAGWCVYQLAGVLAAPVALRWLFAVCLGWLLLLVVYAQLGRVHAALGRVWL